MNPRAIVAAILLVFAIGLKFTVHTESFFTRMLPDVVIVLVLLALGDAMMVSFFRLPVRGVWQLRKMFRMRFKA